jgi:hypothetical protein
MSSAKDLERKCAAVAELARGWGELLAREAYPQGPGTDVSLAEMEEIVAAASKAMVEGAIGMMTKDQATALDEAQPCPTCGKVCPWNRKPRRIAVRGGTATFDEPSAYCSTCRRAFFPSASGIENRWSRIQSHDPASHPAYVGGQQ